LAHRQAIAATSAAARENAVRVAMAPDFGGEGGALQMVVEQKDIVKNDGKLI